ncbi:alpha/beta fold hydrolase [Synechococcus sp. M16CYN]|uniref:alpha/beta fold hydrolase n=1 Tax=Synechococcus sp. M16CYN TaxID=3103139 RepID=UPI0032472DA0
MKSLLEQLRPGLLDPQAGELADAVQWWTLSSLGIKDPFPVAVLGQGPPLLLLHGFDSSFLEYRRLAPLLAEHSQLIIPDLFGFGFSPRPARATYGPDAVMLHLEALLDNLPQSRPIAVIGASMGGSVAMELARRSPERVKSLLLLAPAGLSGRPMIVPPFLDRFGTWFLSRPSVRRGLCRQAFADPDSSVAAPEEQVASLHLQCPGWAEALAAFARSGGFAGHGLPLPNQPLHVIWGGQDRILSKSQKQAALSILPGFTETFEACGHLPHLDLPQRVADRCRTLLLNG